MRAARVQLAPSGFAVLGLFWGYPPHKAARRGKVVGQYLWGKGD